MRRAAVLRAFAVKDVWGVGAATTRKLAGVGFTAAGGLRDLDPRLARRLGTVVLERTVAELGGVSCLELEHVTPAYKAMVVTRSFGRQVTRLAELLEAVATYDTRAGEKLRAHGLVAGQLAAFLHTSPHKPGPRHHGARSTRLAPMSAHSRDLVTAARRCTRRHGRTASPT